MNIGRNDPCICGSGKKYKKCCLNKVNFIVKDERMDKFNTHLISPYMKYQVEEEALPPTCHNLNGTTKHFALGRLEQLIHELKKEQRNDKHICYLSAELYRLWSERNIGNLTRNELLTIKTAAGGNLMEYVQLEKGQKPDYNAMRVITEFAYRSLLDGIPNEAPIWSATIEVDTGDTLVGWTFHESDTNMDDLFINWHSLDRLENQYHALLHELYGFEEDSIRSLATIYMQEQLMETKSKALISYTSLAMGYLGVLEQELRSLISLHNPNRKGKRMMLREIYDYMKEHATEEWIETALVDWIGELLPIRNKAAHGEPISEEEYNRIKQLLIDSQGFQFISWAKTDLKEETSL